MRVSDAVGTFAVVFIMSEDINLTSGSPGHHRNFMDIYLSQFSPGYLRNLIEYQKILKQRNALIKKSRGKEDKEFFLQLDIWDRSLMEWGLKVMRSRSEFVAEISPIVTELALKLSDSTEPVEISYRPKMEPDGFSDVEGAIEIFRRDRDRDLRLGTTVTGPHRDLIEILIDNKPLRQFGSLGQRKSVMIAMKLAAFEVLSKHRKDRAILVLDEAFAEFDNRRAESLLSLLSGVGQVFLASAGGDGINYGDQVKIFDLAAGRITERKV